MSAKRVALIRVTFLVEFSDINSVLLLSTLI